MAEAEIENEGQARHRSPAYPGIPLSEAVSKLRELYAAQKRNTVHVSAAMESMGYRIQPGKVPSGKSGRVLAALAMYGLIDQTGSKEARKVRISDAGFRIALAEDDDPQRRQLLRECAMGPKIYADMVHEWPEGLPSDSAMSKWLLFERTFNPDVVGDVIADFRDTYEFAALGRSGTMSPETTDSGNEAPADEPRELESKRFVGPFNMFLQKKDQEAKMTQLVIPLGPQGQAQLTFPAELTAEQFEDMRDYLETLMKVQARKYRAGESAPPRASSPDSAEK